MRDREQKKALYSEHHKNTIVSAERASSRTTLGLEVADHLRNGEPMRGRCDCTLKGRDAPASPDPEPPSKEEVTLTYESANRVPDLWFSRSLHADFLLRTPKEEREPLWSIDGEARYLQGITEVHGKISRNKSVTFSSNRMWRQNLTQ
jgi:hypothetical protein